MSDLIIRSVIIESGKPNFNGRIYSENAYSEIEDQINEQIHNKRCVLITDGDSCCDYSGEFKGINMNSVVGFVSEYSNGNITIEVKAHKDLLELSGDKVGITTLGKLKGNVVTEAKFIAFHLIPKSDCDYMEKLMNELKEKEELLMKYGSDGVKLEEPDESD